MEMLYMVKDINIWNGILVKINEVSFSNKISNKQEDTLYWNTIFIY